MCVSQIIAYTILKKRMGQKKHKGDSHHNASIVAALISEKACLRANQKRLGL